MKEYCLSNCWQISRRIELNGAKMSLRGTRWACLVKWPYRVSKIESISKPSFCKKKKLKLKKGAMVSDVRLSNWTPLKASLIRSNVKQATEIVKKAFWRTPGCALTATFVSMPKNLDSLRDRNEIGMCKRKQNLSHSSKSGQTFWWTNTTRLRISGLCLAWTLMIQLPNLTNCSLDMR